MSASAVFAVTARASHNHVNTLALVYEFSLLMKLTAYEVHSFAVS